MNAVQVVVMLTWRKGRDLVRCSLNERGAALARLEQVAGDHGTGRIPGAQVFVLRQSDPDYAAARVLEQFRRMHVLPENIAILLLNSSWRKPFAEADNIVVRRLAGGLSVITADHGYMRKPDVPLILRRSIAESGLFTTGCCVSRADSHRGIELVEGAGWGRLRGEWANAF